MFIRKSLSPSDSDFLPYSDRAGLSGFCKSRYTLPDGNGYWCTRQPGHQTDPNAPSPAVHAAHGDIETQYATWLDADIQAAKEAED